MIVAHLLSDFFTGLLDERAHRPIRFATCNVMHKILNDLFSLRCVCHFRMELKTVKFLGWLFNGGKRGVVRVTNGPESFGELGELVPMAVPDIQHFRELLEQVARFFNLQLSGSIFTALGMLNFPAKMISHELHAVANPKHWQAQLENRLVNLWRIFRVNTRRTA